MAQFICLDIGGTTIKYAVADEQGSFLTQGKIKNVIRSLGVQAFLQDVAALAKKLQQEYAVQGIGVSTSGVVDVKTGKITHAASTFPGYEGTELGKLLTEATGLPWAIDNDVNCAGLGEYWLGAGQGAQSLACVALGTGVGGCTILDGKLVHGVSGYAGEVGYLWVPNSLEFATAMSVDTQEKQAHLPALAKINDKHGRAVAAAENVCTQKRLINLEGLAATSTLIKRVAQAKGLSPEELSGQEVFSWAQSGDAVSQREIQVLIDTLAQGLANIMNMLNPELIVLGGALAAQSEYLLPRLEEALQALVVPALFAATKIAFSKLDNMAGILGALKLILEKTAASHTDSDAQSRPSNGVAYAGRVLPLLYEAESAVVGAGVSGLAAAITASRKGTRTVLIEKGIALGGLQTLGDVVPCMQTLAPDSDTAFIKELKKRLLAAGVDYDDKVTKQVWTNPEVMTRIYDEMCAEAGVEVLYNTTLVDVLQEKGTLKYLVVQTIAGLQAIKAQIFVDATGDALLARQSGVPAERGYAKTGYNQPLSFRFEMGGIDLPRLQTYITQELQDPWCKSALPHWEIAEARHRTQRYVLEKFMLDGVMSGELTEAEAEYMQAFTVIGKPGVMAFNCPELPLEFSATDPLSYSKGIAYGRQMQKHISQYFIKHMPGFEHAYISKEASLLGARESWRIRGQYYLTEKAYYEQMRFADAVARTAWFIDAHGEQVSAKLPEGGYYEIPYRSLITQEISNLLVVGRCLSASFILQASMRIQLTCMSIGEAAGVAVNYALEHGLAVNKLHWEDIPEEQRSYISH